MHCAKVARADDVSGPFLPQTPVNNYHKLIFLEWWTKNLNANIIKYKARLTPNIYYNVLKQQ